MHFYKKNKNITFSFYHYINEILISISDLSNHIPTHEDKLINNSLTNYQKELILFLANTFSESSDERDKLKKEIIECILNKNYFPECDCDFFKKLQEIIMVITSIS